MKIYGREYGFKLTVGASAEIADMCRDGDIKNIGELLEGKYSSVTKAGAEFVCAMSRGYEEARAFEEAGYQPNPVTLRMLLSLDAETFGAVQSEAMAAFGRDRESSVEAEPEKKNMEPAATASN